MRRVRAGGGRVLLALLFAEQPQDFLVFGEAAGFVPGEHEPIVGDDIEDAVVAADEFGFDLQFLFQGGRQTGGLRQVVSTAAVFD